MDVLQIQLDRCRKDSVVYVRVELPKEQWPFAFASDAFVDVPDENAWTCACTGDTSAPLRKVLLQCTHPNICVACFDKGICSLRPLPAHVFVPFGSLVLSLPVATSSLPRRSEILIQARTPPSAVWSNGMLIVTTSRSRDARPAVELVRDWVRRPTTGVSLSVGEPQCSDISPQHLLQKAQPLQREYSLLTCAMVEKRVSDLLLRLVEEK